MVECQYLKFQCDKINFQRFQKNKNGLVLQWFNYNAIWLNLENMSYNREDRQMFDAKCGDCGTDCQVPFQPKEGRPVYCRECFQNHR